MNNELVKVLDWKEYKTDKYSFLEKLYQSFTTTGFFFLKNHEIPSEVFAEAQAELTKFFDLPLETRLKYELKDQHHYRGYTPMRIETGEFATVADEKHFWQVGDSDNFGVTEVPELYFAVLKAFSFFSKQSRDLLGAIAQTLGLYADYFNYREGDSMMRAIDYPATDAPLVDDAETTNGGNIVGMCASKHTDINMITLLDAKQEGLQLWHNNEWIPIHIEDPNVIVVNCGDMLEHFTGGLYKSGLHRVVCQKSTRRFSMPYFCHLRGRESILPLESIDIITVDYKKYPFKLAGEFLAHRLAQIGV